MVNARSANKTNTGTVPLGACTLLSLPSPASSSKPQTFLSRVPGTYSPGLPVGPFKRAFQIQFPSRQPETPVADINQNLLPQLWSECVNTAFCALIIIQQMLFTDTVITYRGMYLSISSSQNSCLLTSPHRMPELKGNLGYQIQWMHLLGEKQSLKGKVSCSMSQQGIHSKHNITNGSLEPQDRSLSTTLKRQHCFLVVPILLASLSLERN